MTTADSFEGDHRPSRHRGPTTADWSLRYTAGITPWDIGRPHPELVHRMAELGPPGRAVVPGAGRGHDAAGLTAGGWVVTAIDVVADVSESLSGAVGSEGEVVVGDALAWTPSSAVDLVFDHTFFCALAPARRAGFGDWVGRVLGAGGLFASVVYPVDKPASEGGPPFGMCVEDLRRVLEGFQLVTDVRAAHPVRRSWPSRWAVFRAPSAGQ